MVDPIVALKKLYAAAPDDKPRVTPPTIGRTISAHLDQAFKKIEKDLGIAPPDEGPADLYVDEWKRQVLILAQFDIQLSRKFFPETLGNRGNQFFRFFVTLPNQTKKTSFALFQRFGEHFSSLEPLYANIISRPFIDHGSLLGWDEPLKDFMDPSQRLVAAERADKTLAELKKRE